MLLATLLDLNGEHKIFSERFIYLLRTFSDLAGGMLYILVHLSFALFLLFKMSLLRIQQLREYVISVLLFFYTNTSNEKILIKTKSRRSIYFPARPKDFHYHTYKRDWRCYWVNLQSAEAVHENL